MAQKILTLIGAYGREASVADWNAGKDLKILWGPYCSNRDKKLMQDQGYTHVQLINKAGVSIHLEAL